MQEQGVPIFTNHSKNVAWQKDDVRIFSVPGMHNPVPVNLEMPTNTIFVVETAGLRIAHFGDLGQTEFTAEQLAALGRIDVAFMQFENSLFPSSALPKAGRSGSWQDRAEADRADSCWRNILG